jgi:rRNA-processing protein FCF1
MQRIVLDTSVLLLPAQRRLDVFVECERIAENCEFLVLRQTLDELTSLAAKRDKAGIAARIALELLGKNKVGQIEAKSKKADEALVELARKDRTIAFATTDAPLRRRLRDLNARVICLKGESRLDWC